MKRLMILAAWSAALFTIPGAAGAQRREPERDRIRREEIDAAPEGMQTLYEMVRGLRPHFLELPRAAQRDGDGAVVPIVVYVDARRQAGVDAMRAIAVRNVEDVRYFEPRVAVGEFGAGAANGAIIVKLRRRPTGGDSSH